MEINGRYLKFLQNIFKRFTTNNDHEALINALGGALEVVEADADLVTQEVNLLTAESEWLDEWGSIFGIVRLPQEDDEHFRYRILTCMDDRISIPAITRGIQKILGEDTEVEIFEPYVELRYFNISTFSGVGRYPDPDYWRVGVIDITINKEVTPEVERYLDKITGAGIKVYIH